MRRRLRIGSTRELRYEFGSEREFLSVASILSQMNFSVKDLHLA